MAPTPQPTIPVAPPPSTPPIIQRPPSPPPEPTHIPERREIEDLDENPHYIGRHGRVLPRWKLGDETNPPGAEGLREMIHDARGGRRKLSFVVTGVFFDDYPRKEGQHVITLSYSFGVHSSINQLESGDYETAQDWLNDMLEGTGHHWEDVHSIDIIDR